MRAHDPGPVVGNHELVFPLPDWSASAGSQSQGAYRTACAGTYAKARHTIRKQISGIVDAGYSKLSGQIDIRVIHIV